MNSLFLLIAGVAVFVLGYRFYSKLLALSPFRLDTNYSTPAYSQADNKEFVAANRHVVFGHHFAIVAGATTLAGTVIAAIWGWIPAFLWVLVGTTVAAGVYGLGSLWLAVRYGQAGLANIVQELMGSRAQIPFFILTIILILTMNAVFAWLTAEILTTYPAAVLPFWIQIGLALGLGSYLRRHGNDRLALATVVSIVIAFIAIWLFDTVALAFSGALNIDIRGYSLVSLDATVVWMVLLFVSAYYMTRSPVWKLLQPRGYLVAIQVVILMLILFAGLVVRHPPVVAPNFNPALETPGAIPWIFVTLTSGAIAGFYLLFAGGITAKQLPRETDARYVGYGVALLEGLLALSVILVCTAGFATQDDWARFYASWEDVQDLPQALGLYIAGFANFAGAIGMERELAHTFAAVILAGLIAVSLDAGVRVQKQLHELGERLGMARLYDEKLLLMATVGLAAILALYDGEGRGGLALWPLFGYWNQIVAALGLLLIGLALQRQQQPALYLFAPMLLLLTLTTWTLVSQVMLWWSTGNWPALAGGATLLALEVWLAWETLRILRPLLPAPPMPPDA